MGPAQAWPRGDDKTVQVRLWECNEKILQDVAHMHPQRTFATVLAVRCCSRTGTGIECVDEKRANAIRERLEEDCERESDRIENKRCMLKTTAESVIADPIRRFG